MTWFRITPFSENFYLVQVKPFPQRPILFWASTDLFLSHSVSTSFNVFFTCSSKTHPTKPHAKNSILTLDLYQSQHIFYDSGCGGNTLHSILRHLTALMDAHVSVPHHKYTQHTNINMALFAFIIMKSGRRTQTLNNTTGKACHWAC
jgi:hypothetical protein